MKRGIFALGALGFGLAGCGTASREPANLGLHKREIRAYVDSGQYTRDIETVAVQAGAWVTARAAKRAPGERLAVVFDLDETLLSNWPTISAQDFGYVLTTWDTWVAAGNAPAIEPVLRFYRTVRQAKIDVIILTGRRERDRASTERNLREIGCGEYAELVFKADESKEKTGAFKLAQRQRLVGEGRTIIANIGDQDSDLVGGYAERTFKLPDPFYFTP